MNKIYRKQVEVLFDKFLETACKMDCNEGWTYLETSFLPPDDITAKESFKKLYDSVREIHVRKG